jgi:hypothetical protein
LESIGVKKGSLFEATVYSVLGMELGNIYLSYCNKDQPVLAEDFIEDEEKALARLKELSFAESGYRGDLVSASTESIAAGFERGILDLNLIIKLESVLRRDVFVTMVASLPSRKIDKLDEFVMKNKDWLLAVKKKRDQVEYNVEKKVG